MINKLFVIRITKRSLHSPWAGIMIRFRIVGKANKFWIPPYWNGKCSRSDWYMRMDCDWSFCGDKLRRSKCTVYPKKYAHGFVVLCFVVVMQSFIMNSHEVFIHIHQGCFAGTRAIVRLPQCQWSKPDGYGKISQCITTTKHSKAKTVCIFLGIYCSQSNCFPSKLYGSRYFSINLHRAHGLPCFVC